MASPLIGVEVRSARAPHGAVHCQDIGDSQSLRSEKIRNEIDIPPNDHTTGVIRKVKSCNGNGRKEFVNNHIPLPAQDVTRMIEGELHLREVCSLFPLAS
jgi:hypothetical protein